MRPFTFSGIILLIISCSTRDNNPMEGVWDDGCIWKLVCNKIIDCKGSFYMYLPRLLF